NTGRKTFTLTEEWAPYTATWAELKKPGWGVNWGATTEDTKDQVISISFSDASDDPAGTESLDIEFYVDEVSFTGGDDSACSPVGGGGASNN
ncbi:MAG TPA: hypothetical protein VLC09_01170, partial [Polyangiaceae bacterium]|nr:hypothetical protein [Polyangiaceae bacterium]